MWPKFPNIHLTIDVKHKKHLKPETDLTGNRIVSVGTLSLCHSDDRKPTCIKYEIKFSFKNRLLKISG